GKAVLVPGWVSWGGQAVEGPRFDEPVATIGEDVASDPETLLEIDEPGHAEEGVADDQPRPALTDDLEHLRDRTRLLSVVVPLGHRNSLPKSKLHKTTHSR